MPELGDVEGFRRTAIGVAGTRIDRVVVVDPGTVKADALTFASGLEHRTIGLAERIGKWLLLPVPPFSVLFHFGMTGSLRTRTLPATNERMDRLNIDTTGGLQLCFSDARRLGRVYLAATDHQVSAIIGPSGPDACGISEAALRERLIGRTTIKAALLDQTRVAGIGNFGSDEILWRAGIRPDAPTRWLTNDQWRDLHHSLTAVLRATSRAGRTPRGPRWLTGIRSTPDATCPRCASPLASSSIAGRTSVWCSVCQRAETSV